MRTPSRTDQRSDEPPHPRLVRLDDDPQALPSALEAVWGAGDAAIVASSTGPGSTLPPPVEALVEPDTESPGPHLPIGTALVVPTSGSTGTPRAVVLSHAALAASTAASLAALDCAPGQRWALALPVRHVAGLQVLARSRALGTAPYVVPDAGDPAALAAAAAHAEHIAIVPTQLVRCLDAGVDLTGFRSVLVGGGPLDPDRAAQARAAGVRLVQSYGMTETCGGCVYDGRPLSGVEVAVDALPGGAGRIRLRGPMLATGYLDPSAADADRFTSDGWFVTDDLGRLHTDADGATLLEVIGRNDDVINTGGVKVAPAAVEAALRTLASVRDVAVLAVPDPEWGERIRAVVVPTDPSAPPTLDELRATLTGHLPSSHAPRELVLVETIVRDGLGKLAAGERERLRRM
jgi:O-succinylbenzoic acid--CoA ligase